MIDHVLIVCALFSILMPRVLCLFARTKDFFCGLKYADECVKSLIAGIVTTWCDRAKE